MRTPLEYAKQTFEVLRFSIDQACLAQNWLSVRRDAFAYGFTQSEESTAQTYAQRFQLQTQPDITLNLHYSSVDPSSPFSKMPAISRFELSLTVAGELQDYHLNGFDEPVPVQDKTFWQDLSFA